MAYRQCTRCVMDTSDPDITFDGNGFCNHCSEYLTKTTHRSYQGPSSDTKLLHLVEKIKKNGCNKNYDCILGISGGIDSCYTAYSLKKLGIRALAVHLDNGWNSDISVANIKNVVNKLGFDYDSYVLSWEEFRDLQLAFLRASVPELENPTDMAIPGALHRAACRHNLKYIILGGNYVTEGILPKYYQYNPKDTRYLRAIHKLFGTGKLRDFPMFGWLQEIYYKFIKGIRIIYLLNYLPYSKQDAQKTLENELGWKYYGGKHYESFYTGFVQSYILPEKFNIDYRKATFSTQICTGEITREYAIGELAKKSYDPVMSGEAIQYISKKLGITVSEFNEIMKSPPRTYKDYPNMNRFLELIYAIYRHFF